MISSEKKAELIERISKINKTILKNIYSNFRRIRGDKKKEDLTKKTKTELAKEIVDFILNRELLLKFWEYFSELEKKVLYATLWFFKKIDPTDDRDIERLKEKIGDVEDLDIEILEDYFPFWLLSFFSKHRIRWIFQVDKNYYKWDPIVKEMFEKILERPKGLELTPVSNVSEDLIFHNAEEEILKNIKEYFDWARESLKNGIRLSKKKTTEWRGLFEIKEFFPELKGFDLIKSKILMRFFLLISQDLFIDLEKDPLTLLKDIVRFFSYLGYRYLNPLSYILLFYLSSYNISGSEVKNPYSFYEGFLDLLKELNSKKWFKIDQLLFYAKEKDMFPDINEFMWEYFTISQGKERKFIELNSEQRKEIIEKYIEIPIFKGLFFLFSALGIVDIAYREPSPDDFSSPYEGLSFVKLTPLGEYIFEKRKGYNFSEKIEKADIFADPNLTVLKIKGSDPILKERIARLSEQQGKNIFFITPSSVIRASNNLDDLNENINFLKSLLPSPAPSVWEQLFEEIRERKGLIEKDNEEYLMMKINLNTSPDQIKRILEDKVISKYAIKAESGRIFVKKRHFSYVKKRLKDLGFLF